MTLTLHTYKGNFRAFKILVAGLYNGVEIAWKEVDPKNAKALSPAGRLPVLETPEGLIFESNAIARYVARIRRDTGLYGSTFFESGQVDSWIDFTAQEVELPATLWLYPVIGYLPASNAGVTAKAKADLAHALEIVEKHLVDKTYLVGDAITLADITLASALVYPFKIVCSPDYRKAFPNVVRWFSTIVNQPNFIEVAGQTKLADEELLPSGVVPDLGGPAAGGKKDKKKEKPTTPKEAKPKVEKKKEEKPAAAKKPQEEDAEALEERLAKEEKKKANEHPLKILDSTSPSKFIMDAWKKTYSNASSYDEAMNDFWNGENHFDSEGYSLWYCSYNYNHELSKLFMTCNLVSGFVQRTDELRRWAFGCMWITGKDTPGPDGMYITGCWLFRGQSDEYIKSANPDAEYYTWTKVAVPVSDADKAKIQELWCSETTVEGRPVLDCKVFK